MAKVLKPSKQRTEFAIIRTVYSEVAGKLISEVVFWETTEVLAEMSLALEEKKQDYPDGQLSVFVRII